MSDVPDPPQSVPLISVVIPTFNRCRQLQRTLAALAAQVCSVPFEVIVVSDGSTDGTEAMLIGNSRDAAHDLTLRAVRQDNSGPAAARNRGVAEAHGEFVVFIDDDIVAAPDLLQRHLDRHLRARDANGSEGDVVVVGPMLTPPATQLSAWVAWEQRMLYKQYDALREGRAVVGFRQFYTGNASVRRQRIIEVGGFDIRFRRAEDVELAYRLDRAGLKFVYAPEAVAHHFAERPFDSWLAAAWQYGSNDVAFAAHGQEWLLPTVADEFTNRHRLTRALTTLCIPRPRLAVAARKALTKVSQAAAAIRATTIADHSLSALFNLTYYRGMAEAIGSPHELLDLLHSGEWRPDAAKPANEHFVLVLEQTLGHITHGENLRSLTARRVDVDVTFLLVTFASDRWSARLPGLSNWTVRAGRQASRAIRTAQARRPIDAMFIHTQVAAVLAVRWLRRIPTIVSLDATPKQYDELGSAYGHRRSAQPIERLKAIANKRCYNSAAAIVTWSEWAKQDLVQNYGVAPQRVFVLAPGVDVQRWARPTSDEPERERPVRILFVGADFDRKGGRLLLDAVKMLRSDPTVGAFEVNVVTTSDVATQAGVQVYRGLVANSPELIRLYHDCDVFCLPTLADCLPMVLAEAGIAELALVSTDVGAISEIVHDGETGVLIPPGDAEALSDALRCLINDPARRAALGRGAAALVRRDHDAGVNADRLITLMRQIGARS
ncbi:MAG: glycosyltransferase [Ilumatobacteraceae bacterium]